MQKHMLFSYPTRFCHLRNEGPSHSGDLLSSLSRCLRKTESMTLKGVWSSPENMVELENLMLILEL